MGPSFLLSKIVQRPLAYAVAGGRAVWSRLSIQGKFEETTMPIHDSRCRSNPPGRSHWLGSLRAAGCVGLGIVRLVLGSRPVLFVLLILVGSGLLVKQDTPQPISPERITSELDSSPIHALAWSPDGRSLARRSEGGAILIWNTEA